MRRLKIIKIFFSKWVFFSVVLLILALSFHKQQVRLREIERNFKNHREHLLRNIDRLESMIEKVDVK